MIAPGEVETREPAELAAAFLATLPDQRSPWAAFAAWAQARGLSETEARAVKVAALRARVFRAVGRSRKAGA